MLGGEVLERCKHWGQDTEWTVNELSVHDLLHMQAI